MGIGKRGKGNASGEAIKDLSGSLSAAIDAHCETARLLDALMQESKGFTKSVADYLVAKADLTARFIKMQTLHKDIDKRFKPRGQ